MHLGFFQTSNEVVENYPIFKNCNGQKSYFLMKVSFLAGVVHGQHAEDTAGGKKQRRPC